VTKRKLMEEVEGVAVLTRPPTRKTTALPTISPSQSPISINEQGKYVNPSCLAQLSGDSYQPYKFCTQDALRGSCTAFVPKTGSCSAHCQHHGLQCLSSMRAYNCMGLASFTCDEVSPDWGVVRVRAVLQDETN
jgi:hypothetical protein